MSMNRREFLASSKLHPGNSIAEGEAKENGSGSSAAPGENEISPDRYRGALFFSGAHGSIAAIDDRHLHELGPEHMARTRIGPREIPRR